MPIPLVVDTDCGIDDAVALLTLLASPEVDLRAITAVFGTGPVDQVVQNVLGVLGLDGRSDIPVYRGVGKPLLREVRYSPHVHGENGLGNVERPAALAEAQSKSAIDFYTHDVADGPGKVTVLTLGALTNLALALASCPALAEKIERIFIMGGAFWVPGNFAPTAESNIVKDPEAAAIVLGSGVPTTWVGLDVTTQVVLKDERHERLATGNRRARFVDEITRFYAKYYRASLGLDGVSLPDPTTAVCLLRPDLFTVAEQYVEVDTSGPLSQGKTFAHPSRPLGRGLKADVAVDVDAQEVIEFLLDRLTAEPVRVAGALRGG